MSRTPSFETEGDGSLILRFAKKLHVAWQITADSNETNKPVRGYRLEARQPSPWHHMQSKRRRPVLIGMGVLTILMGLVLAVGGVWLIALGVAPGTTIAAVAMLLTGFLLIAGRPAALLVYALLGIGTLIWSLWEVGLNWWPLAARGAVIFVVGLLLLTPWVTRALSRDQSNSLAVRDLRRVSALRGSGLALTATLATALVVAVISWFNDPTRIEGTVPGIRAEAAADALSIPPGEWHAYGPHGQASAIHRSTRSRRPMSPSSMSPGPTIPAMCAGVPATRRRRRSR